MVCNTNVKDLISFDASKRCGYQKLLATGWLVVVTWATIVVLLCFVQV